MRKIAHRPGVSAHLALRKHWVYHIAKFKSQKDALKGQREILSMRKKKLEREMAKVALL